MFLPELQQLEIFQFHNLGLKKTFIQLFTSFCVIKIKKNEILFIDIVPSPERCFLGAN